MSDNAYIARYAVPLIARLEGFVDHVYYDGLPKPGHPHGTPTIGFGHTGPDLHPGMRITLRAATLLLAHDLAARYAPAVEEALPHGSARQKAALLSAVYNLGAGILTNDHDLGRYLRSGQLARAANSLLEYVNPGTVVERGLRRRRRAERRLFLRGSALKTRLRAARFRRSR